MNTAVARAKYPILMAEAMRQAVEAARIAFLAGRIAPRLRHGLEHARRAHSVGASPRTLPGRAALFRLRRMTNGCGGRRRRPAGGWPAVDGQERVQ